MALLDDEELLPFFGNPNIQRQGARARALAAQRDVNTLPDPRTYAAVSGLLGQAPDEMGFSVLNPQYESIQRTAKPAFALGTLLGLAPMTKGLPVGASIKDVGKVFPTSIANRSEVKNVANDFADQFKQMGFDVTLDHSGSKAGASSYLRVSDPQTGRFLSKPIRISDHSKGARELDANINVLNPQEDFAKITSALNDMRAKGDTLVFKQDRYAQELIASGVKPKTAYQRAKTEIAENQQSPYPQQAALDLAQQRAALPVEQGGLGLPAGNTPAQRAKAMGFDKEGFHATGSDFRQIDPNRNAQSDYGTIGQGFYIDPSPNAAYSNLVAQINQPKAPQSVMPVMFNSRDLYDLTGTIGPRNAEQSRQLTANIKNAGQSGTYTTMPDGSINEVAVFDPSIVRSRFAAFDPFRRSAAVAATMGAAAPDLLAAQQDEEMRKLQQLGLLGMVAP
jgi:hypothetical protein